MPAKPAIYLDANASAPLKREVVEVLLEVLNPGGQKVDGNQGLGRIGSVLVPNPSSIHAHGRKAKRWVAEARERVAYSLGPKTDPEQLIFTSSGTEANQLAVKSVLERKLQAAAGMPGKVHWITTSVEHDSNLQMVSWFKARGGEVSELPVDSDGALRLELLDELWRPETALVSAVWVNNETGVIADVSALSRYVRARGGLLHLDAAQAWGKLPIDLATLGADLVSFSGHKIGAPAGNGLLWISRGTPLDAVIAGKQEKGRRGGTENSLGILALGAAAAAIEPEAWALRVGPLRDRLQRAISGKIGGTWINGGEANRVANTLNLCFDGLEGDGLVMALDLAGYSVSSGSACSSGVLEPSHVLLAMGRTRSQAMAAIRVSLPDAMEWEVLENFVGDLEKIVSRMRGAKAPAPSPASVGV